jgi:hypothetical protein
MTDDIRSEDLEGRLTRALHAGAPVPSPDVTERLLRSTMRVDQRRSWFASHHLFSAVAAAAVLVMAVIVGLQVGSLLPRTGGPPAGSASADILPSTEPAPSGSAESSASAEPSATVIPASPSPSAPVAPDAQRCENPELGYAVTYPEDWFTNEAVTPDDPALDPIEACRYFGEEPIEVAPNAGLPPTVAISFSRQTEAPPPSDGANVLSTEQLTVAGRPATVREIEGTAESSFFGAGDRAYEYLVELPDGDVLQVSTTTDADGDYEEHKSVLDEMMGTLELSNS